MMECSQLFETELQVRLQGALLLRLQASLPRCKDSMLGCWQWFVRLRLVFGWVQVILFSFRAEKCTLGWNNALAYRTSARGILEIFCARKPNKEWRPSRHKSSTTGAGKTTHVRSAKRQQNGVNMSFSENQKASNSKQIAKSKIKR